MASGRGRKHPLDKSSQSTLRNSPLSSDDVMNQGRVFLEQFVHDRLERYQNVEEVGGMVSFEDIHDPATPHDVNSIDTMRQVASALQRIGDQLDQDTELGRLIEQVSLDASRTIPDIVSSVIREILSDNVMNWGRLVAIFYFAFRLIVRGIKESIERRLHRISWIKDIISTILQVIASQLVRFIMDRGGWEAINEYFGTPTKQAVAVLLAGLSVSALLFWKMR